MRDGHDCLIGVHTPLEFFKVLFPVRIGFHRPPGHFHQRPPQLLAPSFGDALAAYFLPTLLLSRRLPGITHQGLRTYWG